MPLWLRLVIYHPSHKVRVLTSRDVDIRLLNSVVVKVSPWPVPQLGVDIFHNEVLPPLQVFPLLGSVLIGIPKYHGDDALEMSYSPHRQDVGVDGQNSGESMGNIPIS